MKLGLRSVVLAYIGHRLYPVLLRTGLGGDVTIVGLFATGAAGAPVCVTSGLAAGSSLPQHIPMVVRC